MAHCRLIPYAYLIHSVFPFLPLHNTSKKMNNQIQIIKFDSLASTNSEAHQIVATARPKIETVVWALEQSNGRGQRDNRWVVEPGKNLTFSIIIYPSYLPIIRQFSLSQVTAIAIADVFSQLAPNKKVTIKWPNDIYIDDKKVGGLLLEHSIMGSAIDYSIVGIGLNVNQAEFPKSLPNPTSLTIETGNSYNLEEVLDTLLQSFLLHLEMLKAHNYNEIHEEFKRRLFRNEGFHLFGTEAGQFSAKIADIRQTGEMVLELADGSQTAYAFKEVSYVI